MRVMLAAAVLALSAGAHADVCDPQVQLDGDPRLVQALHDALSARSASAEPCPPVEVTVHEAGDDLIELEVLRGDDRIVRSVSSIDVAAALVESSSQRHLDWIGQSAWMIDETTTMQPEMVPPSTGPETEPLKLHGSVSMLTAGAAIGDPWMGVTVDTCVKWGWACIGGMGSTSWTTTGRGRDHTLLATAGPELTEGNWFVRPAAAIGWGWNRQTIPAEELNAPALSVSRSELRVGVQVSGGRQLTEHVAWEASAGAYAPAWRQPTQVTSLPQEAPTPNPDGSDPNDNTGDPVPTPNPVVGDSNPADFPATLMMHVSFGIRFGGP